MKTLKITLLILFTGLAGIHSSFGQYSLSTDGAPCPGRPLNITNSVYHGAAIPSDIWNIQWTLNGAPLVGNSSQISLNGSGTYSASFCIGTSASSCTNYTASSNVTILNNTVLVTGPQSICTGQSVTYTGIVTGNTGYSGVWIINGQGNGSIPNPFTSSTIAPGSTVAFSISYACGSASASILTNGGATPMLYAAGNPAQFCVSDISNVLNVSAGSGFQWKLNGSNISGATTSSYHPTLAGNYTVALTNTCNNTATELGPINVALIPNCLPPAVWTVTSGNIASTNNDLTVNGNTRITGKLVSKGFKITLNPATDPYPDYIFSKHHKLRSLEELKTYIDLHGHLPEVKSATEVAASGGIEVGEMNIMLLKKVEELTLYMLQTKKQMDAMQKEIATLKKSK